MEFWRILAVIIAAMFGGLGPSFFKKASTHRSVMALLQGKDIYIAVGAYGLSSILFIPALSGGDLSVLYPLVGTSNVWACIFAVKLLGERMSKRKWWGIGLIVLGLALIGFGS
ncbi:EamA family transporter [Candidatus Woesearchaeota archaeon]|nr:EamA family transporter [Candidatus Woesearchaeota archaeon]